MDAGAPTNLEVFVQICLIAAATYAALGIASAAFLHARGLHRLDPSTRGASLLFRILITPGLIALWPLMLRKLSLARRGADPSGAIDAPLSPRRLRTIHGVLIILAAILLPIAVGVALNFRPPLEVNSTEPDP